MVIGRVVPLLVLEGRAWDTGLENLWVHVDSEGAIDWVGVVDPTLRGLPEDPYYCGRAARFASACHDGIVALPSEAALTTWVAHRSHRALEPLFARLVGDQRRRHVGGARCGTWWARRSVGAATQVPLLAGSSEVVSMRRGQAVLDALGGASVCRSAASGRAGKVLLN